MGESKVDSLLADLMGEGGNPEVSLLASEGEIRVEITSYGERAVEGDPTTEALEREIKGRLGRNIFGTGGDTLEGVVERLLRDREAGLVILETFSAGLAARRLYALPSKTLLESHVIPGREALVSRLGGPLPKGGVEAAESLAAGILASSAADTALVIFGLPGETEIEATALAVIPGADHKAFSWRSPTGFPGLESRAAVIGLNTLRLGLLEALS
jgi:nicotinamide-nucleotide amidase